MGPTLEKIKEIYGNARQVRCLHDKRLYNVEDWVILATSEEDFVISQENIDLIDPKNLYKYCVVYSNGEYAQIVSWKEGCENISNLPIEEKEYDFINPNHYKSFGKETIDMMIDIWGKENVAIYCEITAFKYKMRVGSKPNQPIEQEIEKANWYLSKAKELRG